MDQKNLRLRLKEEYNIIISNDDTKYEQAASAIPLLNKMFEYNDSVRSMSDTGYKMLDEIKIVLEDKKTIKSYCEQLDELNKKYENNASAQSLSDKAYKAFDKLENIIRNNAEYESNLQKQLDELNDIYESRISSRSLEERVYSVEIIGCGM